MSAKKGILHVIVVDDNPADQELIIAILKRSFDEMSFIKCRDMKDFKEKSDWVSPDLICCDYELRSSNGLEVLLEVKKRWNIPFIFVTGTLGETKAAHAILQGADGYVLKDDMSKLPQVVENVIKLYDKIKKEEIDRYNVIDQAKFLLIKLKQILPKDLTEEQKKTLGQLEDIVNEL